MSRPRQVIPNQFYLLTRRCTQRQMLMRPDPETTNAFVYCLALAASRFSIDVVFTLAEGNHHHTIIFDPLANCSAFAEYFHRLFARSQNALRGRVENFWASGQCGITRLLDADTVIEKIVYTATNPVKDLLVERVHHWPGVSAFASFMSGRPMRATRPRHFFRRTGGLPDAVELTLVVPAQLGDLSHVRDRLRTGIDAVERTWKEERLRTGKKILGRRGVLSQSWKTTPTSVEARGGINPRFAGRTPVRIRALSAYRAFLDDYRRARELMLAGIDAVFPAGTYQLARVMRVRVEPAPSNEEQTFWWTPTMAASALNVAVA